MTPVSRLSRSARRDSCAWAPIPPSIILMFSSILATTTRSSVPIARPFIVTPPTSPPVRPGRPNAWCKTRSPDRPVATSRTIFIAGAGIGGLTASLALAAQGFRVVVLEKAERLEEAGAGLQLSPNASRVLIGLGLEPRLAARAVIPDAISIMSAQSGGEIARLPLGEAATARAGAPYWVVHRADLQAALVAEVNDNPDIELRLGCQFEDVVGHAKGLTVVQRRGTTRQQEVALGLGGAAGIWSTRSG